MADISITSVTPGDDCQIVTGDAGATVAVGDWVYKDTDRLLKLADCNLSPTAATVKGMALHAAISGQPLSIACKGEVTLNAVLTTGKVYVLSANAGKTAPVADLASGWRTSIVGYAKTTAILVIGIVNSGIAN